MGPVNGINTSLTVPLLSPDDPGHAPPQPGPDHGPNPVRVMEEGEQVFPQGIVENLGGGLNPQVVDQPLQPLQPPHVTLLHGDDLRVGSQMPLEGVGGPAPQQSVQTKVNQGRELLRNILHGNLPPQTPENVASLMWFFQALGSSKASLSSGSDDVQAMYKAGALMLEDPDGRLEAWLNAADSYSRSSSHLHGFQSAGDQFKPRGVDVRGVETPHDRRTILFQALPRENQVRPGAPHTGYRRMLFIKMEEHGCRGLSFEGHHTGFFGKLKNFFNNIGDFFGHAFGFTQSLRQRHGLAAVVGQDNRERIPSGVKTQYKTIMTNMTNYPQFADRLRRGNPLDDSGGLRQMKLNLEALWEEAGLDQNALAVALLDSINQRDHLDLRIGNEVIFTTEELPQAQ